MKLLAKIKSPLKTSDKKRAKHCFLRQKFFLLDYITLLMGLLMRDKDIKSIETLVEMGFQIAMLYINGHHWCVYWKSTTTSHQCKVKPPSHWPTLAM